MDGKWFDRVALAEDTAKKGEHQAGPGVSSDPSQPGTTAC